MLIFHRKEKSLQCQLPPVAAVGRYDMTVEIDGYKNQFSTKIKIVKAPKIEVNQPLIGFRR